MFCWIWFCRIALIGAFYAGASATGAAWATGNPRRPDLLIKMPRQGAAANATAPMRMADAATRSAGVRLTTTWSAPTMNQGDTIVNTLDVYNAVAGQKIRIQNSNHGASRFTTSFSAAVQAAVAAVPGVAYTPVTEQQMEITLAAGTYAIPITQTVTRQSIPGNVDDAPWAPGTQLQVDWLLSSVPSNGAPVESGYAVNSKWITYTHQGAASDARWSLLRSIPNIGSGGTVTFEIDKSNYALTSSTTLQIAVDGASTAGDADFTRGLDASITAALNSDVSYDAKTGTLDFWPEHGVSVHFRDDRRSRRWQ